MLCVCVGSGDNILKERGFFSQRRGGGGLKKRLGETKKKKCKRRRESDLSFQSLTFGSVRAKVCIIATFGLGGRRFSFLVKGCFLSLCATVGTYQSIKYAVLCQNVGDEFCLAQTNDFFVCVSNIRLITNSRSATQCIFNRMSKKKNGGHQNYPKEHMHSRIHSFNLSSHSHSPSPPVTNISEAYLTSHPRYST